VIYGSGGFLLSTSKNNTLPGEDRQQYKNNDRYLNDLIFLFLLFGPRPPVGGRGILPFNPYISDLSRDGKEGRALTS
jgi:hypothetical protein